MIFGHGLPKGPIRSLLKGAYGEGVLMLRTSFPFEVPGVDTVYFCLQRAYLWQIRQEPAPSSTPYTSSISSG